jgi:uncharacterized protein DUF1837
MDCLPTQLKNAEEIRGILKEVPITFKLPDDRMVKTLLVYLPARNGGSCHSEFFKKVKEGILYNFVFSCSEVEKKLGLKSQDGAEELFEKALRKLSHHTAKGELGELILFTLLDVYFKAPKILSKVSLKTNPRMPVFGADAVHGQFQDGNFKLYLGESKLYKNFNLAATKAVQSINSAKDKFKDEFDLLDSYMDFPNIEKKLESKILDLLNPFSEKDLSDVINSPCFIGFSDPDLIYNAKSEIEFVENYIELAKIYVAHFFNKIEEQNISSGETALLMLPFSCVDSLVKEFIAHVGIQR